MPEGLEKDIPMQDMADLISFVKNWRYLDNTPSARDAKPQAVSKLGAKGQAGK
jgi:hypothetical protein